MNINLVTDFKTDTNYVSDGAKMYIGDQFETVTNFRHKPCLMQFSTI